jgi:SAM-dependent methyltransferase
LRRYVEAYSLFQWVGDVSGLRVLDLACGDGIYSRRLKAAGAAEVVGVDISPGMIELARAEEQRQPQGIRYLCSDAADIAGLEGFAGHFDLIVGAYLFHYAPNETVLANMCNAVRACLAPGGRFVGINENPEQSLADFSGYAQYGFNKVACAPLLDATPVSYSMVSGRELISFNVYYYGKSAYARAFAAAGFTTVNWLALQLDPAGVEACGAEYWHEYLSNPPVVGLELRP